MYAILMVTFSKLAPQQTAMQDGQFSFASTACTALMIHQGAYHMYHIYTTEMIDHVDDIEAIEAAESRISNMIQISMISVSALTCVIPVPSVSMEPCDVTCSLGIVSLQLSQKKKRVRPKIIDVLWYGVLCVRCR